MWEQKRREASRSSLTFSLLGGVEPDAGCGAAGGAGEGRGLLEPGGDGKGTPDLSHQQGAQQVQPTESHNCPEGGKNIILLGSNRKYHSWSFKPSFFYIYLHVRGEQMRLCSTCNCAQSHTFSSHYSHKSRGQNKVYTRLGIPQTPEHDETAPSFICASPASHLVLRLPERELCR